MTTKIEKLDYEVCVPIRGDTASKIALEHVMENYDFKFKMIPGSFLNFMMDSQDVTYFQLTNTEYLENVLYDEVLQALSDIRDMREYYYGYPS